MCVSRVYIYMRIDCVHMCVYTFVCTHMCVHMCVYTHMPVSIVSIFVRIKGGPEPLEKEIHEIVGSKREDRFSNPFFELVQKTCQVHFSFVPASAW